MSGEAAFWLALLALFTGARIEELGQLMVQDVKSADGIDYLEVTDQGDEQKLKNKGSRRSVPLHPELLRLGFLDYVADCRTAGDVWLFRLLKKDGNGKWTTKFSQWCLEYRRDVGVTERWRDFHALRHTFIRQCRECGIPEEVRDAITGHGGGGVGRTYGGRSYPLKPLADAIKTLRYPGLELSGLKTV